MQHVDNHANCAVMGEAHTGSTQLTLQNLNNCFSVFILVMPLRVVLIELRSTAKVFAGYLSWIVLAEVYIQNCAKVISLYFSKSLFGITTFFQKMYVFVTNSC